MQVDPLLNPEPLIRRVLGTNYLLLNMVKLVVEEDPNDGSRVKALFTEGVDSTEQVEVEGKGVGVVSVFVRVTVGVGGFGTSMYTLKARTEPSFWR